MFVVDLMFQCLLLSVHQTYLSQAGPLEEAPGSPQPHTASASCQLHQVEEEKVLSLDASVCLD